MYTASPFSRPPAGARAGLASAYHEVGVITGVTTASPHRLVAMLYDGLITELTKAQGAIAQKDVEAKCTAISRAVRIVDEGLKSALDMQQGGQIAQDLNDLYAYISMRLTLANLRSCPETIEECKRLIEPVREAWKAIGPQVEGAR